LSGTTNWAGNVSYGEEHLLTPGSVAELQEQVTAAERIRAIGSRHSFSEIASTDALLVTLAALPSTVTVDPLSHTATVGGGMTYGDVALALHEAGWALRNLASLPHISIAGACATGTHGSGDDNQGLASAVRSMRVVGPNGELVDLAPERDARRFAAACVGLGGIGIAVDLTLDVEPAFNVEQQVYDDLDFDAFAANLDGVFASAYSVSAFTDFRAERFTQVWRKHRIVGDDRPDWPDRWLGASLADGPRHPIPGADPVACSAQLGQAGPWYDRLPHFRLEFQPSSGQELQSEYLVDRDVARPAFEELRALGPRIAPLLQICELRSVAADDAWLSPAYRRPTVAFHFTWHPNLPGVEDVLAVIEERLEPFDARPHWGKVHRFDPHRLAEVYPRLVDYQAERLRFDPKGVFSNALLDSFPR
jgi:alditol oxidase